MTEEKINFASRDEVNFIYENSLIEYKQAKLRGSESVLVTKSKEKENTRYKLSFSFPHLLEDELTPRIS